MYSKPPEEGPPFRFNLVFRVTDEAIAAIDQAALDCNMSRSEWCRELVDGGLANHAVMMAEHLASLGVEPDEDVPMASDPEYAEKVKAAARAERERIVAGGSGGPPVAGTPEPKAARQLLNPRDCVHSPRDRRGSKCTACGLNLAQRMRGRSGGMTSRIRG